MNCFPMFWWGKASMYATGRSFAAGLAAASCDWTDRALSLLPPPRRKAQLATKHTFLSPVSAPSRPFEIQTTSCRTGAETETILRMSFSCDIPFLLLRRTPSWFVTLPPSGSCSDVTGLDVRTSQRWSQRHTWQRAYMALAWWRFIQSEWIPMRSSGWCHMFYRLVDEWNSPAIPWIWCTMDLIHPVREHNYLVYPHWEFDWLNLIIPSILAGQVKCKYHTQVSLSSKVLDKKWTDEKKTKLELSQRDSNKRH